LETGVVVLRDHLLREEDMPQRRRAIAKIAKPVSVIKLGVANELGNK